MLGQNLLLTCRSLSVAMCSVSIEPAAADAGLRVSADAVDAGPMLLMLVVSWPRSACVSNVLALGMLPHVCLSMFGGKLVCWVKTCLTCPRLCLARCSHVGTELLLLTCYVGSKLLPPVLCFATFGLLQCDLAPAASLPWQLQ